MAEGIARALGADAASAGVEARRVRPEAIAVMREIGIDISSQESKTYERFLSDRFDEVVTVCDDAKEACPNFPGAARTRHWSIPDPSAAGELSAFRSARDQLRAHIERLLADR